MQCLASGESPSGEDLAQAVRMQLAMVRMERAAKDPSYRVSFQVFADIMKIVCSKEAAEFLEDDVSSMSSAASRKEPPSEAELRTHFTRFDVDKRGDISGAAMQVSGVSVCSLVYAEEFVAEGLVAGRCMYTSPVFMGG